MAYRAFDERSFVSFADGMARADAASAPETKTEEAKTGEAKADAPTFGPHEQSVIALAGHDTQCSVRQPGRLFRLIEAVFGFKPANRLADPRLEALRRFAVLARVGRPSLADVQAFLAAGFSERAALSLSTHTR